MKGKVYLVGAGPGDPGLITLKGLECLAQADVVVYDRLLDERLLDSAPAQAERIYVGKASSAHTREQSEISQLLVDKAREGKIKKRNTATSTSCSLLPEPKLPHLRPRERLKPAIYTSIMCTRAVALDAQRLRFLPLVISEWSCSHLTMSRRRNSPRSSPPRTTGN